MLLFVKYLVKCYCTLSFFGFSMLSGLVLYTTFLRCPQRQKNLTGWDLETSPVSWWYHSFQFICLLRFIRVIVHNLFLLVFAPFFVELPTTYHVPNGNKLMPFLFLFNKELLSFMHFSCTSCFSKMQTCSPDLGFHTTN